MAQYFSESLKLLIKAHKDSDSKIEVSNWNEVIIKTVRYMKSLDIHSFSNDNLQILDLLIKEHEDPSSTIKASSEALAELLETREALAAGTTPWTTRTIALQTPNNAPER